MVPATLVVACGWAGGRLYSVFACAGAVRWARAGTAVGLEFPPAVGTLASDACSAIGAACEFVGSCALRGEWEINTGRDGKP